MDRPKIALFGYGVDPMAVMDYLIKASNLKIVVVPKRGLPENIHPVCNEAFERNISWVFMDNLIVAGILESEDIDLALVYCFTMIIPDEILSIPRLGFINIHPGLLPEYRGPHPIGWAIEKKEEYAGVTIHHMDTSLDTGDIIARKKVRVWGCDTVPDLKARLMIVARELLEEYWERIITAAAPREPQDESMAHCWPKREGDY